MNRPPENGISTPKVMAFCGSIRSVLKNDHELLDICKAAKDLDTYLDGVNKLITTGTKMCNSEIIAGASLCGALSLGADLDYFSLSGLFPQSEASVFELLSSDEVGGMELLDTLQLDQAKLDSVLQRVKDANGLILATPVYFGDRSSVANKILQLTATQNLLSQKVMGVCSVGAKRNGGQETTNLFALYEALNQNALGVGNGPPTSQYGGTAVAGNRAHVLEDRWGLLSAFGTGQRVAHVSQIFKAGEQIQPERRVQITILVSMDTQDKLLAGYLAKLVEKASVEIPNVNFTIINLIDFTIFRCLGCSVCPVKTKKGDEISINCAIREADDVMAKLRSQLLECDGLIVAGLNLLDAKKILYRYQVLLERTRFIRRHDFELTNLMVAGLCYNQVGATVNPLHSLKANTSFLRHNTVIHKSIEIIEHQNKILKTGLDDLIAFCRNVVRFSGGKKRIKPIETYYMKEAYGGYRN
jgi:multimeric flavodoxin WrbA